VGKNTILKRLSTTSLRHAGGGEETEGRAPGILNLGTEDE